MVFNHLMEYYRQNTWYRKDRKVTRQKPKILSTEIPISSSSHLQIMWLLHYSITLLLHCFSIHYFITPSECHYLITFESHCCKIELSKLKGTKFNTITCWKKTALRNLSLSIKKSFFLSFFLSSSLPFFPSLFHSFLLSSILSFSFIYLFFFFTFPILYFFSSFFLSSIFFSPILSFFHSNKDRIHAIHDL